MHLSRSDTGPLSILPNIRSLPILAEQVTGTLLVPSLRQRTYHIGVGQPSVPLLPGDGWSGIIL